jgi:hypothetical protein
VIYSGHPTVVELNWWLQVAVEGGRTLWLLPYQYLWVIYIYLLFCVCFIFNIFLLNKTSVIF